MEGAGFGSAPEERVDGGLLRRLVGWEDVGDPADVLRCAGEHGLFAALRPLFNVGELEELGGGEVGSRGLHKACPDLREPGEERTGGELGRERL